MSGDEHCNVDSVITLDDPSSLSHCNASSLDINTSSTINAIHACVDSPSISCVNCSNKSHDDMLALLSCHDINASIFSSICVTKNVEETKDFIRQDNVLFGASSSSSFPSSSSSHVCLMAKASTVSHTSEANIFHDDENEGHEEEEDLISSLHDIGEVVFRALRNNKIASSKFVEILVVSIESQKLIEMHENTILKMGALEREYADEIGSLKDELEEEQTTKESLEETFSLELSRIKENHDRDLEVANDLKLKNDKLVFVNAKLLEDFEQLKNGSRVIESALTKLTESHEQLKASYLKEHANLPSPIATNDDACATNSTSCEASILEENVELRAQLELLT